MNLILTKRAQRKFFSIKEYIKENFGEKIAEDFEQNATDFLNTLIKSPLIGAVQTQNKDIRAVQLTKQTTVFTGSRFRILLF